MRPRKSMMFALLLATCGLAPAPIQAQLLEPVIDAPDDVKQQIQEVYALTRTARTARDFSRVIDACRAVLEQHPADSDAAYLRSLAAWALTRRGFERIGTADAFQRAGNRDQADEVRDSAWNDFEESTELQPDRAKAWLGRAFVNMMRDNYTDALHDLETAATHDPDSVKIRFHLAEVQLFLGKCDEAIKNYDAVLKQDAEDMSALTGRGHANLKLKRFEQAVRDYQVVAEKRGNQPNAWINLGMAQTALHQWSDARDSFRRSLQLEESPEAIRGLANVLIHSTDEAVRDLEEGVTLARRLVAIDGRTLENLDLLSDALQLAGHQEQWAALQQELEQRKQATTTSGTLPDRDQ